MSDPKWRIALAVFQGGTADAVKLVGRPVRTLTGGLYFTRIDDRRLGGPVQVKGGITGYVTGAFGTSLVITLIDPPLVPLPPYDRYMLIRMDPGKRTVLCVDWEEFRREFMIG